MTAARDALAERIDTALRPLVIYESTDGQTTRKVLADDALRLQSVLRECRAALIAPPAQGEPQPARRFACFTQEDGVYESPIGEHVAYSDYAALRAENERQAREISDMSVDIEKYRNEIAKLKSERDAAQRAGVTTANYWMERAELAEDQRERTRDVWATRAERAEAECDAARRYGAVVESALAEKFMQHHGCAFQTGAPCDGCVRSAKAAIVRATHDNIDAVREGK